MALRIYLSICDTSNILSHEDKYQGPTLIVQSYIFIHTHTHTQNQILLIFYLVIL